ncbi:hypothetical protein D9M72_552440 [compost metagenome]
MRFLWHEIKTEVLGERGRGMRQRPTVDFDAARIGRDNPGHDLHQAGLACAIAPEKCVHFPGFKRQRDPLQNRHCAIGFPDVLQKGDPPGRLFLRHSPPVQMYLTDIM